MSRIYVRINAAADLWHEYHGPPVEPVVVLSFFVGPIALRAAVYDAACLSDEDVQIVCVLIWL